ncbi:TPA: pyrroline-5-carboxylate reductase [Candidatus Bathyarchaeota archaeon]|nr:pyrroline-5-carboxylate reductase [Candidatus Bathyarchaeota archaeon]
MKITVIGAGRIGGAIARALLEAGFEVTATRKKIEKIEYLERLGAKISCDNKTAAKEADLIMICVKPKDLKAVLQEIRDEIQGKIVISFVAAVKLSYMKKICPEVLFVRVMPNLSVLVRSSLIAYCSDANMANQLKESVENILRALGKPIEIEESKMDAITALSGCAPAYLSIVTEALVYAGLKVGLSKELALLSAAQAMMGMGKLILEKGLSPYEIKDAVATPGGVTIEGLTELESIPIRYAFIRAVTKAMEKSINLSKLFE